MQSNDEQQIVALLGKVYKRRKLFIALCAIGVLLPIVYYNQTATPIYRASTELIFDEFAGKTNFDFDTSREILLQNRLEEIQSLGFAEEIAHTLSPKDLNKFELPADVSPDFVKMDYINGLINRSLVAFPVRGSNIISMRVEMSNPELCMILANTAASVFQDRIYKVKQEGVGGVLSFIEEQVVTYEQKLKDSEDALKNFRERNKISSIDRGSGALLTKSTNAEVRFNTAVANRRSAEETLRRIEDQVAIYEQKLKEDDVADIATPQTKVLQEKLSGLRGQLGALAISGYDDSHEQVIRLNQEIEETALALREEVRKVIAADNILDPLSQLPQLLAQRFTLRNQVESFKAQEKSLRGVIADYEKQLGTLPQKDYELAQLVRRKDVNEKIYVDMLARREEAKIAEAERIANMRIIDMARMPLGPIRPTKILNLAVGIVLGLLVGVGLGIILEMKNQTVETSAELESLTEWPVLAAIPVIEEADKGVFLKRTNGNAILKSSYIRRGLLSELDSKNPIAETFRMFRTNLQFLGVGKEHNCLLVTSIGPDEGKSTSLTNLAITFAKMKKKVLLVDLDLRRPVLHAVFDLDREPGLSDLLVYHNVMKNEQPVVKGTPSLDNALFNHDEMDDLVDNFSDFVLDNNVASKINGVNGTNNLNLLNSSIMETVQSTDIENLKILTSGKKLKNPSETVADVSLTTLLSQLKNLFDVILIDSAPILLIPESMVISSLVDGVIFVVDAQRYNHEMMLKAKAQLKKANANVLGTVLNRVDLSSEYKGKYYYYG